LADTAWVRIQVGENSVAELSSSNFILNKQLIKQGILYLDITSTKSEEVQLGLFNLDGKQIISSDIKLFTGNNALELKLGALSKGVYLMNVSGSSERIISKLVLSQQ